jgi:hypothetical protein
MLAPPLSSGTDAMRCLRLSSKSRVLRWYADCCRAPIGNTAAGARFPIVAITHSLMDHEGHPRDEVLGGRGSRSRTGPGPRAQPRGSERGRRATRETQGADERLTRFYLFVAIAAGTTPPTLSRGRSGPQGGADPLDRRRPFELPPTSYTRHRMPESTS